MTTSLFVVRRLVLLIPVCFGVMIVMFIIGYIIPANPLYLFIGQDASPQLVEQVRAELGLDLPLWVQFYKYMVRFFHGDFGMCWSTGNPVLVDLIIRLPATLELMIVSFLITLVLSFPLGVYAALKHDTFIDQICRVGALLGVAIPGFWFALLLIYFFYFRLRLAPPPIGRIGLRTVITPITGLYLIDTLLARDFRSFGEVWRFLALPVVAVSFRQVAQLVRLVRASVLEVLDREFVQSAKALGLSQRVIHYRLVLKNALIPPLTQLGELLGHLFGGLVVIELVFAWPGLGRWAITSALAGDFAPVQAFAVMCAGFRLAIFLITDILYAIADPRIKFY